MAEAGEAFYEEVASNLHLMHKLASRLERMAGERYPTNGEVNECSRIAREIHLSCDKAHRRYCEETQR